VDEGRELTAVTVEDLETPVARQQFSLGAVVSALGSVLVAGMPLRRVPAVEAMAWQRCGIETRQPSWYTVRLWLMRLGLYQLVRPQEQADDWMWIIDHTSPLGDRKCLLIVGVRQSAWDARDRVLKHEDVSLIDLVPVTESNGQVVYRQLEAAVAKTGVPRSITSDAGSDLHCGIEQFCRRHRGTAWIYDIKHKTACLLKHAMERDAAWSRFVEQVHRFKQQVSLTDLAALAPPSQRSKSRYMNVDVLTDWVTRSLALLDSRKAIKAAGLKYSRVEAKLGWLRNLGPAVRRWVEMLAVVGAAEHHVRHEGIHARAADELAAVLPKAATPAAKRLRKDLLAFVGDEAAQTRCDERLLGSSEVLESIIGKFKHVAGERGDHGLTGMVLSIGAQVGKPTVATVETALRETPTHHVSDWCHTHLGSTVQSVRGKIRHALRQEQNRPTLLLENG
jgi:hypothetical protein